MKSSPRHLRGQDLEPRELENPRKVKDTSPPELKRREQEEACGAHSTVSLIDT